MFENPARTRIGKITQPSEIVCYMSSKKGVDVAAQVEIGADLTNDQRAAVEDVINKYADVFAANPKNRTGLRLLIMSTQEVNSQSRTKTEGYQMHGKRK